MKAFDWVAAVLVIVGAVNWGLFGAAGVDLVRALLGTTILASIAYILVGVAGAYQVARLAGAGRAEPMPRGIATSSR
jgi:uncharacterized membrane protein YuzA (DUF378 family)